MVHHRDLPKLRELIEDGTLPPWSLVDWVEVYEWWVKTRHTKPLTPKIKAPRPRALPRHRFQFRAATANARAKRVGAEGVVTPEELEDVWQRDGGCCQGCGVTEHLVFDHVVPYYRGGVNRPENLQLLCRICNMEKGVS